RLNRANDWNAVLDVSEALHIAAGQSRGVGQNRNGESAQSAARGGIVVENRLRRGGRDERNWRYRTDVITADVVFAAHVEAIEGRYFLAAKSVDIGHLRMQSQNIAAFLQRLELLKFEDVGNGIHVAADGAAGERERVEIALASRGFLRIIDA